VSRREEKSSKHAICFIGTPQEASLVEREVQGQTWGLALLRH